MERYAAILDRDGVINDNRRGVVNQPADFVLYDTASEGIRLLKNSGFLVLVATNQGGVGLGYMSEADLEQIHIEMQQQLGEQGAAVDEILACTHAPDVHCNCRKPQPGMILSYLHKYQLNRETTYMVGDRRTDVEAGRRAGVRTVFIGKSPLPEADYTAGSLLEAAKWMVGCKTEDEDTGQQN